MNKLKVTITGLFTLCLGMGVMYAQSGTNTPAKPASTQTAPAKKATPAKAKTATTSTKAASGTSTTKHLKKDGTPDMRYKENKAAAGKTSTKKATKTSAKPAQPATSSNPAGK